jgi:uncharacterized protein YqjF (DUF2071 family)
MSFRKLSSTHPKNKTANGSGKTAMSMNIQLTIEQQGFQPVFFYNLESHKREEGNMVGQRGVHSISSTRT